MDNWNKESNIVCSHENVPVNEQTNEVHKIINSLFIEAANICKYNFIIVVFNKRWNKSRVISLIVLNAECIFALELIFLLDNCSFDFLHSSFKTFNLEFELFFL